MPKSRRCPIVSERVNLREGRIIESAVAEREQQMSAALEAKAEAHKTV